MSKAIDIEEIAREAGVDDSAALTPYMIQRLEVFAVCLLRRLEEAIEPRRDALPVDAPDEADDAYNDCISLLRDISRQVTGATNGTGEAGK